MIHKMGNALIFFLLTICTLACRKKPLPIDLNTNPPNVVKTSGEIQVDINNVVGNRILELNSPDLYQLNANNQFGVSTFKYYLSNFVLSNDSGLRFVDSNSYYLVDQSIPASKKIALRNVPFGRYTKIEFLIGIDSLRNVSGAQVGFLSPSYGMFWTWNTGYIMAKMEGRSPQSPNFENAISYHIGGFKDPYNVVQKVILDLPNSFQVNKDNQPHITMNADLLAWFDSFLFLGFAKNSMILKEGAEAQNMAISYANMFSISNTHF